MCEIYVRIHQANVSFYFIALVVIVFVLFAVCFVILRDKKKKDNKGAKGWEKFKSTFCLLSTSCISSSEHHRSVSNTIHDDDDESKPCENNIAHTSSSDQSRIGEKLLGEVKHQHEIKNKTKNEAKNESGRLLKHSMSVGTSEVIAKLNEDRKNRR